MSAFALLNGTNAEIDSKTATVKKKTPVLTYHRGNDKSSILCIDPGRK